MKNSTWLGSTRRTNTPAEVVETACIAFDGSIQDLRLVIGEDTIAVDSRVVEPDTDAWRAVEPLLNYANFVAPHGDDLYTFDVERFLRYFEP